jgi:ferrochelatase
MKRTAVFLIGFGGPAKPEEVRPFVESVLEGIKIPEARFQDVLHHYDLIGGVSKYNSATFGQKEALQEYFKKKNVPFSVGLGLRHSFPSFKDAFETFGKYNVEKLICFVMAPFRSYSSFEKYQQRVEKARLESGTSAMELVYTESFFDHPLLIQAQTERVSEVLKDFSREDRERSFFIFSAHSIPVEMSRKSSYDLQFERSSSLIAGALGLSENWRIAYQSRSGAPRDPWLEPDVQKVIASLDGRFKNIVFVPMGFLCDNVEVVYDLDVEAKKTCEEKGLRYFRAATVGVHPKFIEMMAEQILEKAGEVR